MFPPHQFFLSEAFLDNLYPEDDWLNFDSLPFDKQ